MTSPLKILAAVVAAGAIALGGGALAGAATQTPALNRPGKVEWNFEALLYQTFHTRDVSERGSSQNFSCPGYCSPSFEYNTYVGIFANATRSAYHLSTKRFPAGAFGNYPVPVEIKGRLVACDNAEHTFLVAYAGTANFSLGCLAPTP